MSATNSSPFGQFPNPLDPDFWSGSSKVWDWVAFVWKGQPPVIRLEINNVYGGQRFSAKDIYQSIIELIKPLQIPDVRISPQTLHEGGPFTAYRIYLKIEREFSQFLICAAPIGTSYFVTVRKIDRFPHTKWFHYLLAALFIGAVYAGLYSMLGPAGANVTVIMLTGLVWSIMRYAAYSPRNWFTDRLPEIPIVAPLYLRWFRPDTFFRQDLHSAFSALVDQAVRRVVDGLNQAQAIRPATEQQGGPILKDLHTQ